MLTTKLHHFAFVGFAEVSLMFRFTVHGVWAESESGFSNYQCWPGDVTGEQSCLKAGQIPFDSGTAVKALPPTPITTA
jgi:hypothetical protein